MKHNNVEIAQTDEQTEVMPISHCQFLKHPTGIINKFIADVVSIEEPLQLSLSYFDPIENSYKQKMLLVMMRTPGEDYALIIGFLFSEGIISDVSDIECYQIDEQYSQKEKHKNNAVLVTLKKYILLDWKKLSRHFINHSSCGICGKTLLNSLSIKKENLNNRHESSNSPWIDINHIFALPELLLSKQKLFNKSGGSHAVAYILNNEIKYLSEDIGRHNAVDKVIGQLLIDHTSHENGILLLSGRVSLELMQKAVMANINVIVAIGPPSSLAIKVAQQFDITLIGFVKENKCNVYHGKWRIS